MSVHGRTPENTGSADTPSAILRPLNLRSYVAVETEAQARSLERYFKAGSGKAVAKKRLLAR